MSGSSQMPVAVDSEGEPEQVMCARARSCPPTPQIQRRKQFLSADSDFPGQSHGHITIRTAHFAELRMLC